jgi:aerobic carbon-monoxide dehydrogenase large subunit
MTARFGASQPLARVEDPRLLAGAGRFTDDVVHEGQAYAAIVRSPHAHARIVSLATDAARRMPGVSAVFTAGDMRAAGVAAIRCTMPVTNRDGTARADPVRYPLAETHVRHVGDAIAMVVAESLACARDAAEAIEVEYEPLAAAIDPVAALADEAPRVWDDVPGNLCLDWGRGDAAQTDAAFARAAHVAQIEVVNNRVSANPLEPRGANARYDAATERWTITASTQGVFFVRDALATCFGVPAERFRVITPDVGGGFGIKIYMYPEYALVAFAARALGRPVKWTPERGESLVSDVHGRDNVSRAELALDHDGRFLALRVATVANLGAYLSDFAPLIPTAIGTHVLPSIYRFAAVAVRVRGVFTHTVPVDAYRGAGKPESHYLLERLIDVAARATGIDRIELRRRNLIEPRDMPWTSLFGMRYDSGDFPAILARALEASDWRGFAQRRDDSRARGRRRGIGLACYIEATGGAPTERAEIRFDADGGVSVLVGTQSNGQGHETAYVQLVSEALGVAPERLRVVQGDTDVIASGGGTGGSRSLYSQGEALVAVIDRIVARGRDAAGRELECAPSDLEFTRGAFRVVGTDRRIALVDLAARLAARGTPLDDGADARIAAITFPNGCHVAEVEIDAETGAVRLARFTVVDDMGNVLNPTIVTGQVAGGAAQGIGQALMERACYDADGQLVSGSFSDYAMPRADDLPPIDVVLQGVPCATNALGVKGAGEAGAIGAAPAVVNAIVDALGDRGVAHIDMPVTAERVWRALAGRAA